MMTKEQEEKYLKSKRIEIEILRLNGEDLKDKLFEYGYTLITFEKAIQKENGVALIKILSENSNSEKSKLHTTCVISEESYNKLPDYTENTDDVISVQEVKEAFARHIATGVIIADKK